jgi:hypothetical protein
LRELEGDRKELGEEGDRMLLNREGDLETPLLYLDEYFPSPFDMLLTPRSLA